MGCIETLGWEKMNLEELEAFAGSKQIPIFVLETGGTPVNEFQFPDKGICIIGSEELGVSPEALDKACFFIAGIDEVSLLQAVDTAVTMNQNGDYGIPVPDYIEENVSTKVVKIIQSYVGIVNKMVWRKF